MNHKATVTKELNAKHMKVLEGLLKLPENKECADCKSKAPRWASINLGIFICLHCSGIHRSLGVHISKVRSATLDTWLPEQVAFMQSMGNEKSNAYWEAELPQHYDRIRFDNFIRSKYVERKWVPRDGKVKSPPWSKEELTSERSSRSGSGSSIAEHANYEPVGRKDCSTAVKQEVGSSGGSSQGSRELYKDGTGKQNHQQSPKKENHPIPTDSNGDLKPVGCGSPREPALVVPDPGPKKGVEITEPADSIAQSSTVNTEPPVVPSPKVDYATELFRMLCVDDSADSDSSPSSDMSEWIDFETDEEEAGETTPVKVAQKSSISKIHPETKIDDVQATLVPETEGLHKEYQKDAANVSQNFPKQCKEVLASSISLAQVATPTQVGYTLPNATRTSYYGTEVSANIIYQHKIKSSEQPVLNGARSVKFPAGTQIPMLNIQPEKPKIAPIAAPYTSLYRPTVPRNGVSAIPVRKPPSALPVSGYDYDFSFLTQGLFTK